MYNTKMYDAQTDKMSEISIVSNKDVIAHLYNVEEYYCTEKMFYVKEKSGSAHYYNLDEIRSIHITESEE